MPANTSSTLYRIDECPDVMADACVGDDQGNLIFLSIWARDTAVQQFLARLTLGRDEQGLDQFHVITDQGGSVRYSSATSIAWKSASRAPTGERCSVRCPTCGCSTGAASSPTRPTPAHWHCCRDSAHRLDRLWMLVRDTCPLPLLDHWRETVLELLQSREMLARLPFALGPLEGHRLAIDVPALSLALGSLIRSDALTAYPYPAKIWTPEAVALDPPSGTPWRASVIHPRQPGDFHGSHVPAARPQFRQNGYYPTDEPTLERALNALMPSDGPMCILDPCAGEGVAIAEASHALGREQTGVRRRIRRRAGAPCPRPGRSLPARGPDGHDDLQAVLRTTVAESTVWRPVQDVNGNIGYQGQGRARLEKLFYQRSLSLLQYGGVLVFIVPGYVLDAELVGWLTRHYTDLRIYRAVETQFKQVVIFGRRVRQRELAPDGVKAVRNLLLQVGLGEVEAEELPSEWPFLPYIVPASPAEPEHFFRVTMEPEQFADEVGRLQGLWPSLDTHLGTAQQSLRPPARALSHWHLALALAAGAISSCAPRRGACSSSKVTPTRTRRSSGNSPNAKTAPSPRHASSPTSLCPLSARGT